RPGVVDGLDEREGAPAGRDGAERPEQQPADGEQGRDREQAVAQPPEHGARKAPLPPDPPAEVGGPAAPVGEGLDVQGLDQTRILAARAAERRRPRIPRAARPAGARSGGRGGFSGAPAGRTRPPAGVSSAAPRRSGSAAGRMESPMPFPSDFLWGAATAAYQIEGAAK